MPPRESKSPLRSSGSAIAGNRRGGKVFAHKKISSFSHSSVMVSLLINVASQEK